MTANEKLVLALPKGRILKAITPLLTRAGIEPEDAFFDEDARQLQFATRDPELDIIRVGASTRPLFWRLERPIWQSPAPTS